VGRGLLPPQSPWPHGATVNSTTSECNRQYVLRIGYAIENPFVAQARKAAKLVEQGLSMSHHLPANTTRKYSVFGSSVRESLSAMISNP